MDDLISRQAAIEVVRAYLSDCCVEDGDYHASGIEYELNDLPSAQPEEVIPHRNYKYLSDYWCECGWHLGKKGDVKYCADCGRKVKWDG